MTMTFAVRAERKDEIEKLVAWYSRKAAKYGVPLTVTYSEPYATKVAVLRKDYETHTLVEVDSIMVEAIDMTIDCDVIRKDGYSVIAKIEHLEGGNVVYAFGCEPDAAWSTMAARCEHCGGNHHQKVTFIVEGQDGSRLQVGSTCLKEYCGIDPMGIGVANQLSAVLLDEDVRHIDFETCPCVRAYNSLEVLALAIRINREYGYVRSGNAGCNKDRLANAVAKECPTEAELDEARGIAFVIKEMDWQEACSNLLDNVQALLKCGYCKATHFGFIAYAPVAYERYMEKVRAEKEREAARNAEAAESQYVGEIGKRETFKVRETKLVTHWETAYGTTWLYKFKDENGNVLVWFASGIPWDDDSKVTAIKATVKGHNERDGVKQTVVTRVKVA